MASAMIKCSFRSALRGRASHGTPAFKRTFASSAHHDEAREAAKWEKITYVGIITCTILAIVNLSKGHPHHEEPPVRMVFSRRSITKTCILTHEGLKKVEPTASSKLYEMCLYLLQMSCVDT
ncbi:cytochrome c oxidase subunit 6a, mitochondrial-like isoform X1 [Nicotiana tabacum]|uniref:Cytochrome c oxidase subunit 6a, mitochondrial-like isoform X1 n=1 Tax=Nicotiana tabacum TaxID=4097 RepID=A0AC58TLU2_TOBAC